MACQDDAMIEVYGDWIRKTNQNPPNADQNNRNEAQESADRAADGAGDQHCSTGTCPEGKVCAGVRAAQPHRSYSFEDGEFRRVFYIRCKVVARYHCECKDEPQKGEKKGDKKPRRGKSGRG